MVGDRQTWAAFDLATIPQAVHTTWKEMCSVFGVGRVVLVLLS